MSGTELWSRPDTQAFFSDTTGDYVTPSQPDLYDWISIRLRVGRGEVQSCFLVTEKSPVGRIQARPAAVFESGKNEKRSRRGRRAAGRRGGRQRGSQRRSGPQGRDRWEPGAGAEEDALLRLHMKKTDTDALFDYYEARFEITSSPLRYYFEISAGGRIYRFTRRGVRNMIRPADWWHIVPGFHTPAWAEGAVMYQIFVDRFCNGDKSNDVLDGEYRYGGRGVIRVEYWDAPPTGDGYREFYGGDLQGVIDKLDYLQGLGVEAIYLNPIFLSPSSHKYDTQDYEHIDPHFGRIVKDLKETTKSRTNRKAARYLRRVTGPDNLAASDRLFARLVREAHARGIKVILDGVFNHCGSFHRWLDGEKIYEQLPGGVKGARASKRSPYRDYFLFHRDEWPDNNSYDGWWNFGTLPKLHYEQSEDLCNYILQIGRKWVSPPYNADGWRLDVAADLGTSEEFNHLFWKRFRQAVREANPNAIILAENYQGSWKWLQGDEWDTIMNYEFFMEPVTTFLTGMEKHSDGRFDESYGDPDAFWEAVLHSRQGSVPDAALRISMNELSNHDHSRFLTRTNRVVGRTETLGPDAADEDVRMQVMRLAVLLQMTWTGAPTIYYGDEAGLTGFTDPDCRRTYPWGREDRDLIRYHRILISLRSASDALRRGSLLRLPDTDGILAYARFCRGVQNTANTADDPGTRTRDEIRGGAGTRAAAGAGSASRGQTTSGARRTSGSQSGTGPASVSSPHAQQETCIVLININEIPIEYEAVCTYAGVPLETELMCLMRTDRTGFAETFRHIPVRDGRIHLTLPPESGFLFRWRPGESRLEME